MGGLRVGDPSATAMLGVSRNLDASNRAVLPRLATGNPVLPMGLGLAAAKSHDARPIESSDATAATPCLPVRRIGRSRSDWPNQRDRAYLGCKRSERRFGEANFQILTKFFSPRW
jgi:hypothetical protein